MKHGSLLLLVFIALSQYPLNATDNEKTQIPKTRISNIDWSKFAPKGQVPPDFRPPSKYLPVTSSTQDEKD